RAPQDHAGQGQEPTALRREADYHGPRRRPARPPAHRARDRRPRGPAPADGRDRPRGPAAPRRPRAAPGAPGPARRRRPGGADGGGEARSRRAAVGGRVGDGPQGPILTAGGAPSGARLFRLGGSLGRRRRPRRPQPPRSAAAKLSPGPAHTSPRRSATVAP